MLRLTARPDASGSTILAEGRLVGEWADLLEAECVRLAREVGKVELDLEAVTDIDSRGLMALRRLCREAIVLRGLSPLMQAVLSEETTP
jgi:ABC-type transporter Mla MlaB component